ncbi:MAG: glycerate kinase [Clostridiales Family XIII bacterium]|jgi:glycerate kinase|nr:glycerate kinase [Clostridiales Family XIII bacterium]
MKIVIAPDSFKGSMTAKEASDAIAAGILSELPQAQIVSVPMADGGEGTVQSIVDAEDGTFFRSTVRGPLGAETEAVYGVVHKDTAIIEMAEASGLYLLAAPERNPLRTTTFGTGQLIIDALNRGCRKFLLGIGGSATNDGGAGLAQALGFRLLDEAGEEIPPGGGGLTKLHRIDAAGADPRLRDAAFTVACDVQNLLCGPCGASAVFGPQKGATSEMVKVLDENLGHFAQIIRRDLGKDVAEIPGAGASGGLGAGCLAFLDAELKSGVEIVIGATGLQEKMRGAALVFTGEGQCDAQTADGKTAMGVAALAKSLNIPVILIAGSIGEGAEALYPLGVSGIFSIAQGPVTLEEAMRGGAQLLEKTTARIVHLLRETDIIQ